ncbi:recombining binding protein suppressor of hairless-like protein isoform X1 [Gadus morhua]|uniref:recombining binding protein suppressor of hairless-like protein isoform X1 n=1 Tax=Gadus morhua TaxID=8049 RepID=UPI0011B4008B|nr:recombining binding protein suppressor of hairless-like protein isoform X1 [Gadus morhua]XP_030229583.1 recombining binding protein suppressor of hairless-like protein isoform X1 [Gadus morhua]
MEEFCLPDGEEASQRHHREEEPIDAHHLYPFGSPVPFHTLTHLGSVTNGPEAPKTSGWARLELGFQGCQQPITAREPGNAPSDQTITILHAKVAQKSYGNEKRFFCPPPCVYISGRGWRLRPDDTKAPGYGDSRYGLIGYMCLDSSANSLDDTFKLAFDDLTNHRMFASAKSLYISDQDKRKHFRLLLRLFLSGQEVGSFQSRMIKVISKPSQKRQSMKNADLCISSGSRVALFNRLRSQTVSTRFLSVDRHAAVASSRQWTAFTITLVQGLDQGDYILSEGFICYSSVVKLVCTETGVALPPMVIRKVNKQHAILDVDEPVSQLHKCSFQFREEAHSYLCLSNDTLIQHQGSFSSNDPGRVVLSDGCCWTIIGVEAVEFSFNQNLAPLHSLVSPVPVITGLQVSGGGHVATLEVQGENFTPHLKIWFSCQESETMFRSPKSMLCVIPDVSVFGESWRCMRRVITVPLSLMRSDGLIYRSSYSFTYTPELQPPPPARGAGGAGGRRKDGGMERVEEDDALLESIHQEFTRANFHLFMQS